MGKTAVGDGDLSAAVVTAQLGVSTKGFPIESDEGYEAQPRAEESGEGGPTVSRW